MADQASEQRLEETWMAHPRPFVSSVPLIGTFIAGFRQFWYNVAARWQDQMILDQQNQLREEIAKLRRNQEYLNHLLRERGLEIGALAEEVAHLTLDGAKVDEPHI